MNLVELVAAVAVGALLLWLIAQPLLVPLKATPAHADLLDPEETPRGQALLALKEIEFDRATGKLSDSDYAALHARYTTVALAALDQSPGVPAVATGTTLTAPDAGPRRCAVHGECPESDALFCTTCGLGTTTADGACAACGSAVLPEARFCSGCGAAIGA
ncbi:MAG TPA: hypothetical protein VHW65_02120 [Gemmatimonadales bacterium]|jgi:hypothetical protein|nr:hypothetical protein [Gemmatimonadales bacterium]